ncbi:MAG: hypothetical protein KTR31_01405 [Myxococcales bacterium]|nr:hypothetical protein [Myxococcales bacterium]
MAFTLGYWLFTMLGALDVEALDSIAGDIDLDLDVDVDVDVDVDAEVEADAAGSPGMWWWLVAALRLGRIPVSVSLSLFLLGGWMTSFLLAWAVLRYGGPAGLDQSSAVFVGLAGLGSVLGGATFTNASSRPLEPVFRKALARGRRDLLGEVCSVTTGRVDARFGQAEITVDSDHMVIQVRCDAPGLGRGDRALVISYDPQREAFVVEPLADTTRDPVPTQED